MSCFVQNYQSSKKGLSNQVKNENIRMLGTIFPNGNFPNVQFPKRQLAKSVLAAALAPPPLKPVAPQRGQPNLLEVPAWVFAHLGSWHLGSLPWEST